MLYDKLQHYKETGQLVAICRHADGEGLLVGRVLDVTETQASFALIDSLGQPDEDYVVLLEAIHRLEEIPDYMERLALFATIDPPIVKAKGQITRTEAVIRKRLREAVLTGECVSITLLADNRQDYRVLKAGKEFCELLEFGDHPLRPLTRNLVRYGQIVELKWRSSGEMAVTALWRQAGI